MPCEWLIPALDTLDKCFDCLKSAVGAYDVEGLYVPDVVQFQRVESRFCSDEVKFCHVFQVMEAFLTEPERDFLRQHASHTLARMLFVFPRVKHIVDHMSDLLGYSTHKRITVVFVCSNYRALKYAGIKTIHYLWPSIQFLAEIPRFQYNYDYCFVGGAADAAAPGLLAGAANAAAPVAAGSIAGSVAAPDADFYSFHHDREDLLRRKRAKLKVFHSTTHLIDLLMELYPLQIRF